MSKAALARLKRIEEALRPSGKGSSGIFSPIQIWRQNDIDPTLFRPENGGDWVDESEMLTSLPAANKRHVRLVIVRGCWSQIEQRN